jgi:2-dehydropantoate 2-reductase
MRVCVFGSGAIGTYVGVQLSSHGADVTLVGRPWLQELAPRLSVRTIGGAVHDRGKRLTVIADVSQIPPADLVLVTVKSQHTVQAAEALVEALVDCPVVSLQNGLRNAAVLRDAGLDARAGMVSFNVFRDDARFVQATSGPISIEATESRSQPVGVLAEVLRRCGEQVHLEPDLLGTQAGKLLLNLNNGICALTGLSIADSVRSRPARRAFAACIEEAVTVLEAAEIKPATVGKLPPWLLIKMLPAPDWLVLRAAPGLIQIDPRARSSTLQDLEAGKATEIDALNGEFVELGARHGVPTPANGYVVRTIRALETAGLPVPHLTPEAVWEGVSQAISETT